VFPISISLEVYRAGNGKGQVELVTFGVAAEFSLLGQLFQGRAERFGAYGAEFAQLLDREHPSQRAKACSAVVFPDLFGPMKTTD